LLSILIFRRAAPNIFTIHISNSNCCVWLWDRALAFAPFQLNSSLRLAVFALSDTCLFVLRSTAEVCCRRSRGMLIQPEFLVNEECTAKEKKSQTQIQKIEKNRKAPCGHSHTLESDLAFHIQLNPSGFSNICKVIRLFSIFFSNLNMLRWDIVAPSSNFGGVACVCVS